jgi:hypothetical protein
VIGEHKDAGTACFAAMRLKFSEKFKIIKKISNLLIRRLVCKMSA